MSEVLDSSRSHDEKRRSCMKDCSENFKELVEKAIAGKSNPRVAIFTHAMPDPDAIGSLMGLSWLLYKRFNVEADCYYSGEVSHPQNNAIVNLLDPQLKRVSDEYQDNSSHYCLHLLVDTIPINAGVGDCKITFDCVIDHHKDLPNGGYSGLVIHGKTGSCSAIIFQLMKELCLPQKIWFEDDNDNDKKVATSLIAGIITDTEFMVSDDATELEHEAFTKLFPYRNSNFLKQIVFFKRSKFWVDAKAAATSQVDIDTEGYAIVGLGILPEKQRDLLADMAEEMLSWASVEVAIAFAVVGGDRIEGSVRSLNASVSVSELCKRLGGNQPSIGIGGGKLGKGAYRRTLGGMAIDTDEDEDTEQKTWELIKEKESRRIRRLLSK